MNIWDYDSFRIRLTDTQGKTYVGTVINVSPAGETEEEVEDCLDLETDSGTIYGFHPSDIRSIEKLK